MRWLALDIGGANLKAADGRGFAVSRPFALWKSPEKLAATLRDIIAESPAADCLAATMTGELADCFRTKADGVRQIVESLVTAAEGRDVKIYLTTGEFCSPAAAIAQPLLAAASNWHALAKFAGQFAPSGVALLLDIGSTTCDIIPLLNGVPNSVGVTDTERLLSGELVYTGVERSPVCAITQTLPWRGKHCPVAQELFATSWDAYLRLGWVPEEPLSTHTADGRPATKEFARDRLARIICADREMFNDDDADRAAAHIWECQQIMLEAAMMRVIQRSAELPATYILSGQGEFLGRRMVQHLLKTTQATSLSLNDRLGPMLSRCAPAHALACLASKP